VETGRTSYRRTKSEMTSPGSAATAGGGGSLLMPGTWVAYTASQSTSASPGSVTSTATGVSGGQLSVPPPDILVIDVSSAESTADGNDAPHGPATSPPVTPESSRRQWRRSSWCPEQDRKKEEKQEMQRSLAVVGKRYTAVRSVAFCRSEYTVDGF